MAEARFTREFIEEQERLLRLAREVDPNTDPALTVAIWHAQTEGEDR